MSKRSQGALERRGAFVLRQPTPRLHTLQQPVVCALCAGALCVAGRALHVSERACPQ